MKIKIKSYHNFIKEAADVAVASNSNISYLIRTALYKDVRTDLNYIDVSKVTNMESLFNSEDVEDLDVSKWDVSKVTNMDSMFAGTGFKGDISKWNVGNVKTMSNMFEYADKFNSDISKWNVAKVTDMSGMFSRSEFNKDISKWNVKSVVNMSEMFYDGVFSGNLQPWDSKLNSKLDAWHMFVENRGKPKLGTKLQEVIENSHR